MASSSVEQQSHVGHGVSEQRTHVGSQASVQWSGGVAVPAKAGEQRQEPRCGSAWVAERGARAERQSHVGSQASVQWSGGVAVPAKAGEQRQEPRRGSAWVAERGDRAEGQSHVGCDQERRDREEAHDEALKLGTVIQRVKVPSGKASPRSRQRGRRGSSTWARRASAQLRRGAATGKAGE
jgi:hypothetical protein